MNGVRAFPQQVGRNACCVIHHYEGLEKISYQNTFFTSRMTLAAQKENRTKK